MKPKLRDLECSPEAGLYYLRNRRLVTWLFEMRRADGEAFPAGTVFEVLRQDGDRLNLCATDLTTPFMIGKTIVGVETGQPDATPEGMGRSHDLSG